MLLRLESSGPQMRFVKNTRVTGKCLSKNESPSSALQTDVLDFRSDMLFYFESVAL